MTAWPCDAIDVVDGRPQVSMPPRIVTGAESVVTRVAIRLWTLRGVWPDDRVLGCSWLDWLRPGVTAAEIEGVVRRQVAAVEGVSRVVQVAVTRTTTINVAVQLEASDGDDGTVSAVVGDLGIYEGVIPGAWYQILGTGHRPILPVRLS